MSIDSLAVGQSDLGTDRLSKCLTFDPPDHHSIPDASRHAAPASSRAWAR